MWLLDTVHTDKEMSMDASLKAAGSWCRKEIFSVTFPQEIKQKFAHIMHLELWAVIVSIKLWGKTLRGKIVHIHTDNEAVAFIINTGRSTDLKLQQLLRELSWWLALYDMKIKGSHLMGIHNRILDLLSRIDERQNKRELQRIAEEKILKFVNVPKSVFTLTHNW